MKVFLQKNRWEIGVALTALTIHLLCFFFFIQANNGDVLTTVRVDDGFYELAKNVLAGNGFSWSAEAPYLQNTMRTPGYVWLLAGLIKLFGETGAAIVQLIAATAIPLIGIYIARAITQSRTIGIATGIVLALDPTLARLSFQFYTETTFLLFFLSWLLTTLYYLKRPTTTKLLVSAFLFGGALLIKASIQYIPFILIPCSIWAHGKKNWRQGLWHSGAFILIVGMIVSPWILRNMHQFDTPAISTQATFILYTNFVPAVMSIAEKRDFNEVVHSFLTQEEYRGDAITFANQNEYKEKAIAIITDHPAISAFVAGRSLFTFFTNDGFYDILYRSGLDRHNYLPFLIMMRLVWIGITITAFIGACIYLLTRRSPQAVLVIALVAYFALISTITAFGTNPRYRLPVDPIILSFAIIGASTVLMQLKNHRLWKKPPQTDTK